MDSTLIRRLAIAVAGILAVAFLAGSTLAGGDGSPILLGDAAGQALTNAEPPPVEVVETVRPIVVLPDLPIPEPVPVDPYAPTPEIRHGTIEIPAIGLSQPLFEGVTLTAIDRGPSHWPGTAMPGELGNVVIAGHRTTSTRPFWDLHLLEPGDELVFDVDAGRFVYELTATEVVAPEDIHIIEQQYAHTATLFACHPRGSARQRIVGHFVLVSEPPVDPQTFAPVTGAPAAQD